MAIDSINNSAEQARLVVLISDRLLFRKTFAKVLLTIDASLQIIEYSDGLDGLDSLDALPSYESGWIILDSGLLDDIEIVEQMLRVFSSEPEASLVVVLDEQDDQRVEAAMSSGAAGVLIKASPPQVLVEMLQRILSGDRCRPAPTVTISHDELPEALRRQLSARQQKLLRLMMGGQSISATASTLGLTPGKVVREMRLVLGIVRGRSYE